MKCGICSKSFPVNHCFMSYLPTVYTENIMLGGSTSLCSCIFNHKRSSDQFGHWDEHWKFSTEINFDPYLPNINSNISSNRNFLNLLDTVHHTRSLYITYVLIWVKPESVAGNIRVHGECWKKYEKHLTLDSVNSFVTVNVHLKFKEPESSSSLSPSAVEDSDLSYLRFISRRILYLRLRRVKLWDD